MESGGRGVLNMETWGQFLPIANGMTQDTSGYPNFPISFNAIT